MRRLFCITGILLSAGCHTMNADADTPAVITGPDRASRAALQAALASSFGGQSVTIADDALTTSSLLLIEHGPRASMDNRPVNGRVLEKPIRFRLVKNGDECVLVDLRDDSRHILADTDCAPE